MLSTLDRIIPSICIAVLLCVTFNEVWNIYTRFECSRPVAFAEFLRDVQDGKIEWITVAGSKVFGVYRHNAENFHTYPPPHYRGLSNKLDAHGIPVVIKR
jgi:hypothetical protein